MADPTSVNPQITDSLTQAHLLTVGSAAAMATASALQAMAHAAGLAMMNAVSSAQQWSILNQAATAQAANEILLAGIEEGDEPPAPAAAKSSGKKGG